MANTNSFPVDSHVADEVQVSDPFESPAAVRDLHPWQSRLGVDTINPTHAQSSADNDRIGMNASVHLPSFVKSLPQDIDQDTLRLLRRRGALTLPSQSAMEEFLRVFVCYVYPMLPLLDLSQLLNGVHGRRDCTISLVLLQAVFLSGAAFVDVTHLQSMGFDSRLDARDALFCRVRLLYEMDVEREPLTVIQVLLMMTYWQCDRTDTKGPVHWLRIAISLAIDIGLDREERLLPIEPRNLLRRRLWYCCIMREKLLSLTERRLTKPSEIPRLGICTPQPPDFEEASFADALSLYYMPECKVDAARMVQLCIQKFKLCLIIGRILESQYEPSDLQQATATERLTILSPKKLLDTVNEAVVRDQELHKWRLETTTITGSCFDKDHRRNGRVLAAHSSTLEMLYYIAIGMVHRPQLLEMRMKESASGALQEYSQQALRSAARRISEIGRHLQEGYLVRFLPSIAVAAFTMSATQHLKDGLLSDTETRSTGHLYLAQTLNAFAPLEEMYSSMHSTLSFIERVKNGDFSNRLFEMKTYARARHPSRDFQADRDVAPMDEMNATNSIRATSSMTQLQPQGTSDSGLTRATMNERTIAEDGRGEQSQTITVIHEVPSTRVDFSEFLINVPFEAIETSWPNMDWL